MESSKNEALPKTEASLKNETSPETAAGPKNETLPKEPKEAAALAPAIKKSGKKRIVILSIVIIVILVALYFLFKTYLSPKPSDYGNMIDASAPAKTTAVSDSESASATTTEPVRAGQAIAGSENFDLLQINLEGSGTNVFDLADNEIFTIDRVASELYSVKDGDKSEIRAVISCKTNKRSYAEAEYFKNGEKDKKIIQGGYLDFNHILIIPDLDPDSVYKYSVSATDLNQIKIYSEQFVFYTGAGNISLVDLLSNAVEKVFGWTMGK